jgi:hypothetical protein
MDSVESMKDLVHLGQELAKKVDLSHFGDFIKQPLT